MTEGRKSRQTKNEKRLNAHVRSIEVGLRAALTRVILRGKNGREIDLISIRQLRERIDECVIGQIVNHEGFLLVHPDEKDNPLATLSIFYHEGQGYGECLNPLKGGGPEEFKDILNKIEKNRREFLRVMYFNLFGYQVVLSLPVLHDLDTNKTRIIDLNSKS